jgi:hypothetical protein
MSAIRLLAWPSMSLICPSSRSASSDLRAARRIEAEACASTSCLARWSSVTLAASCSALASASCRVLVSEAKATMLAALRRLSIQIARFCWATICGMATDRMSSASRSILTSSRPRSHTASTRATAAALDRRLVTPGWLSGSRRVVKSRVVRLCTAMVDGCAGPRLGSGES